VLLLPSSPGCHLGYLSPLFRRKPLRAPLPALPPTLPPSLDNWRLPLLRRVVQYLADGHVDHHLGALHKVARALRSLRHGPRLSRQDAGRGRGSDFKLRHYRVASVLVYPAAAGYRCFQAVRALDPDRDVAGSPSHREPASGSATTSFAARSSSRWEQSALGGQMTGAVQASTRTSIRDTCRG
jgi:hypothetical protein